jgi:cyclohexanecarboxyl-CoA dehydrogenase
MNAPIAQSVAASRVLDENEARHPQVAVQFAREELAPRYQAREKTEQVFDHGLLSSMRSLGLIAPDAPERYGGLGLPCAICGFVAEAIGYSSSTARTRARSTPMTR